LRHGVTTAEREAVAAMRQNLKGTPHENLALLILNGIGPTPRQAEGNRANVLQEIRERIVGGPPPSRDPVTTWQQDLATGNLRQKDWNKTITDSQVALSVKNGHVGRGFHEKELFGGRTTFKANPSLPEEARIPPFWDDKTNKPTDLSGVVHLTNGQGCPFKDAAPDVRGLAVKLVDGDGKPWDILATNKQTIAQDVSQFVGFAEAAKHGQLADSFAVGQAKQLAVLTREVGPVQATRISAQLFKDTILHQVNSLATESFDGGTFRTPQGHLAKIVLEPVPGAQARMTRDEIKEDPNGLTTELYKQFEHGPVKYRVQLKIFAGNGDEKDFTDKWDPHKLIDLGELSIPPPDKNIDALVRNVVHGMRFNPGTGFEAAGGMTIARGAIKGGDGPQGKHTEKGIYQTSADNRLALMDDATTLKLVRDIGKGAVAVDELKALSREVDRRREQMQDEVKNGTVEQRVTGSAGKD
jgi:hypothetical protein